MFYKLLEAVDSVEEIIFAEEAGSWMIPMVEWAWLKTHLTFLAASDSPHLYRPGSTTDGFGGSKKEVSPDAGRFQ